ncbi:hypothetical protein BGW42_007706 [Actinomortierella wolfii]|nr:hypothetical protein BGW42_007706 [Actinomortierella wolfii]
MSDLSQDTSEKLGKGSYGTVYKGKWALFMVAAKKFHISTNEAAQVAIQREINALEKLSYEHIIRFYGIIYHEGQLVMLTELAEQGSLTSAIQKGIKDWSTKERFAREMLLGLAFIHTKGVLHLDLKRGRREEIPEETPPEYRAWIERCWEMDPSKRPEAGDYFQEKGGVEEETKETDRDSLDNSKTTEDHGATRFVTFSYDESFAISSYTDTEGIGREASSGRSMYTMRDSSAHNALPNEITRHSAVDPRSQSVNSNGEQFQVQHHVSKIHLNNQEIKKDNQEADRSTQSGYMASQDKADVVLVTDQSAKQNDAEVTEWRTRAAEQGVQQNDEKTVEWYTKAANQGGSDAQHGYDSFKAKLVGVMLPTNLSLGGQQAEEVFTVGDESITGRVM